MTVRLHGEYLEFTNRHSSNEGRVTNPDRRVLVRRRDILGAADGKLDGASIYMARGSDVYVTESVAMIATAIVQHDATWHRLLAALALVKLLVEVGGMPGELLERAREIAKESPDAQR